MITPQLLDVMRMAVQYTHSRLTTLAFDMRREAMP